MRALRCFALLLVVVGPIWLVSGCSKQPEEAPAAPMLTSDGKPVPPEALNAPAAPGMDDPPGARKAPK